MTQFVGLLQGFHTNIGTYSNLGVHNYQINLLPLVRRQQSFLFSVKMAAVKNRYLHIYCTFSGREFSAVSCMPVDDAGSTLRDKVFEESEFYDLPYVQTLRNFPKEELFKKVVLVRFDSSTLLREKQDKESSSMIYAVSTIKYLHGSGAKVILLSNWNERNNSKPLTSETVVEILSSVLKLEVFPVKFLSGELQSQMEDGWRCKILVLEDLSQFKEEVANCPEFAKKLSFGVDILVNDAFSQSHKILASTVGVSCFCYACIAGFHFEQGLHQLRNITSTKRRPYIAIIGGSNLKSKGAAVKFLASRCDGLIFVGSIAFSIMYAMGLSVPMSLVEHGAYEEAVSIVRVAKSRSISVVLPQEFWCMNDHLQRPAEIFPAHCIPDGWQPVDVGPSSSENIASLLPNFQKIIWIGPLKFSSSSKDMGGTRNLALMLHHCLSNCNCDITVVGKQACNAVPQRPNSDSTVTVVENASVTWEYLKGRKLPGLLALDRAYPFTIDWTNAYADPTRPLVVDVGSGNGLFIFRMAKRRKDLNFLGLEINGKLVSRCLDQLHQFSIKNGFFITTNATSTFRSIVSSYPGSLILVSIQCPNPDFTRPEHRWRMLQRSLVEAITDLLVSGGKVFLQSDIEAVALRMKEQFQKYGQGKLTVAQDVKDNSVHLGVWLKENPFGAQSDWEEHVLDRGGNMYRLLLTKSSSD